MNGIGSSGIDIDISLSGLQGANYTSDDRAASSYLLPIHLLSLLLKIQKMYLLLLVRFLAFV